MEPTPSIFATLAELKDFLAQRPAAVHLGAGISIALSGQSVSARDFHRAGLELARKNGLIDAKQLSRLQETLASEDPDDQTTVAAFVEAKLRPRASVFRTWLESTIGNLHPTNPAIAAPLAAAARDGLILSTTNYDRVLGEALGLPLLAWTEFRSIDQLQGNPTILHLDGIWDNPESLVLVVRRDERAAFHRDAIQAFLAPLRFLLLVGVGPTFFQSTLCQQIRNRRGTLPGALLCREEDLQFFDARVHEHLPGFRLVPFSGGFDALPRVLETLLVRRPEVAEAGERTIEVSGDVLDLVFSPSGRDFVAGLAQGELEFVDLLEPSFHFRTASAKTARVWTLTELCDEGVLLAGTETGDLFGSEFLRRGRGAHGDTAASQQSVATWEDAVPRGVQLEFAGGPPIPEGGRCVWELAYSAPTRFLATARDSGHIEIYERLDDAKESGARGLRFRSAGFAFAHAQGALAVAFSPDGRTLASAGHDRAIRFWSVPDLKPLRAFEGHDNWVGAIAFSPDGTTLASTGGDRTVVLWDVHSGQRRWRSGGHTEWVQGLSFHPSGEWIATGSWDTTVRVWAVADGSEVARFDGHSKRVWTVAFSPDGDWLASGGDDRTVRLWPIDVAALRKRFPEHQPKVELPSEFLNLVETPERFSKFLARLTLRHREGLECLESLEPGSFVDLLRHAGALATDATAGFADTIVSLESRLGTEFEPPALWMSWMRHVRGVELTRLGRELIGLAERGHAPAPAPTEKHREPEPDSSLQAEEHPIPDPAESEGEEAEATSGTSSYSQTLASRSANRPVREATAERSRTRKAAKRRNPDVRK